MRHTKIVFLGVCGLVFISALVLFGLTVRNNTPKISSATRDLSRYHLYAVTLTQKRPGERLKPFSYDATYGRTDPVDYIMSLLGLFDPSLYSKDASSAPIYELQRKYISDVKYDKKHSVSPYDDQSGNFSEVARYNYEYLILFTPEAPVFDTNKIYEDEQFTLRLREVEQGLKPFIFSASYCEVDADCSIGYNVCAVGSYNNYESFRHVGGCEEPRYLMEDQDFLQAQCHQGQTPSVKYAGPKCIRHSCAAESKKITCENYTPI